MQPDNIYIVYYMAQTYWFPSHLQPKWACCSTFK